jgi:hypothetical protein
MMKIIGTFILVFWLPFSLFALDEWSKALTRVWSDRR